MNNAEVTPTVLVVDDDDGPSTPEACSVACDPQAALSATLGVVGLARRLSGIIAIMLELVRSQRLFEKAGYPTMKSYAAEKLNITNKNTLKKALSAGRSAWGIYPDLAEDVVAKMLGHRGGGLPELPAVPPQSALEVLPQAIERGNDPNLAERVRQGAFTVKALTRMARLVSEAEGEGTSIRKEKKRSGSNGRSALMSLRMPHELLQELRTHANDLGVKYQTLLKDAVEQGLPRAVRAAERQRARTSRRAG